MASNEISSSQKLNATDMKSMERIDNSYSKSQPSETCVQDPKHLLNTQDHRAVAKENESREQVAERETPNGQQTIERLKKDIKYKKIALRYFSHDLRRQGELRSDIAEDFAQIGHLYFKICDYRTANEYYLLARKENPEHFQALNLLGEGLIELGEYELARLYLYEIVQGVKHEYEYALKATALQNIAYAFKKEKKEGSLRNTELQILIENTLKKVHACIIQKSWLEAKQLLEEARRLSPNHPVIQTTEQRLRDAVSTNAFTSSDRIFFHGSHLRTQAHIDETAAENAAMP